MRSNIFIVLFCAFIIIIACVLFFRKKELFYNVPTNILTSKEKFDKLNANKNNYICDTDGRYNFDSDLYIFEESFFVVNKISVLLKNFICELSEL